MSYLPTITAPLPAETVAGAAPRKPEDERLWLLAQKLESTFLAEMLKHAGFGEAREEMGGGVGEEQFASFLREEHAAALVRRGGIGLAEHLFRNLKERADASV